MPTLDEAVDAAFSGAPPKETAGPAVPGPAPAQVEPVVQAAAKSEAPSAETATRSRDDKGRFAPKDGTAPVPKPGDAAQAAAPPKPPVDAPEAPPQDAATPEKPAEPPKPNEEDRYARPPQSWGLLAKGKWDTLPTEVRKEIHLQEGKIHSGLRRVAEERKALAVHRQVAEAVDGIVRPYAPMFHAEGVDALTAVDSLLKSAAMLRTGPLPNRAAFIATLIKQHGVPLDMLVDALEGKGPQLQPHQPQPRSEEQRPLTRSEARALLREEWSAREAETDYREARGTVDTFLAGKEFADEVREDMGALMKAYAERGKALDLARAYELAVAGHPEAQQVMAQRKAAAEAEAKLKVAEKQRAAAGSIGSSPVGAPVVGNGASGRMSLDDAVGRALAMASRRV